jgi:flagellar hook protein FlgE
MVPVGNIAPQATSTLTTKANFDANAPVISAYETERLGVVVLDDGATVDTYNYRHLADGTIEWTDSNGVLLPAADVPTGAFTTGPSATNITLSATGQLPALTDRFPTGGENIDFAIVPPIAFDPINSDSYTHFLPMNVYDSLGNAHQLTQYFVKRDAVGNDSVWDVYYRLDNQELPAPYDDASPAQLTFDAGGRLMSGGGHTIVVPNPGGAASPAEPLTIAINYGNSTQYGGAFSPNFTQNGYPTGEYASMSIAADGAIVANYTNGEVQAVGTLVLADFNNLQGLQPVGGNAWIETATSGQPILGRPGSNSLATIKGQAVEESNVDMSQELVNMIIAQRTYQANAQTIKTQDQIMQTLISMR